MDNQEVIVSVSMITYNHELYLNQAIEGVLMQQTNFMFELIIADDNSPDRTESIIKHYIDNHPQGYLIKYFRHENNLGMNENVLFALNRSKGKYIATCDGDDYWIDPYKLQKQVDFLEENSEYGLIHTDFNTFYQSSNLYFLNSHVVYNVDIKGDCALEYWNLFGKSMATIKTLTVCIRKEIIEDYLLKLPNNKWTIGDFPMFFFAALHSKIGHIKDPTAVYRTVSSGSASNVGRDYTKLFLQKKTYVDIRLFYLTQYNLEVSKFGIALLRDLNILFEYCIITDNKSIIDEYLNLISKIPLEFELDTITKLYFKYNSLALKKSITSIIKCKILTRVYLPKFFNFKFLKSRFLK